MLHRPICTVVIRTRTLPAWKYRSERSRRTPVKMLVSGVVKFSAPYRDFVRLSLFPGKFPGHLTRAFDIRAIYISGILFSAKLPRFVLFSTIVFFIPRYREPTLATMISIIRLEIVLQGRPRNRQHAKIYLPWTLKSSRTLVQTLLVSSNFTRIFNGYAWILDRYFTIHSVPDVFGNR